jgi:hypothetical protein
MSFHDRTSSRCSYTKRCAIAKKGTGVTKPWLAGRAGHRPPIRACPHVRTAAAVMISKRRYSSGSIRGDVKDSFR